MAAVMKSLLVRFTMLGVSVLQFRRLASLAFPKRQHLSQGTLS